MPTNTLSHVQRDLLQRASTGIVIVGELGLEPLRPNHRIFSTADGAPVHQRSVTSLLSRGMLKVISTTGEYPPRKTYMTVTELGRLAAAHAAHTGRRAVKVQ
jgi:hypothetical protein